MKRVVLERYGVGNQNETELRGIEVDGEIVDTYSVVIATGIVTKFPENLPRLMSLQGVEWRATGFRTMWVASHDLYDTVKL